MKLKYKISNDDLRWEVTVNTEAEWLTWKYKADANKWYGENYLVTTEIVYPVSLTDIRNVRNQLLTDSDKWLIKDYPLPINVSEQQILDYRKALRDFPATVDITKINSIDEVVFPTKPF